LFRKNEIPQTIESKGYRSGSIVLGSQKRHNPGDFISNIEMESGIHPSNPPNNANNPKTSRCKSFANPSESPFGKGRPETNGRTTYRADI